jgi:beta-galactosidase GanA
MSKWKKGVIWVNGHNLGRYWNRGPQTRLFCPGAWLKKGENSIILFDMHALKPETINGVGKLQ